MKNRGGNSQMAVSNQVNVLLHFMLALWSGACILPFILLLSVSFSTEASIAQGGYRFIPGEFSLDAYTYLFRSGQNILNAFAVTTAVTVLGTLLSTAVIGLYAYAASRKTVRYRHFFTLFAAFSMLFSGGLVPFYMVCTQVLHLKNTLWAMVLPGMMDVFLMIVMRTFYARSVPEAVLESARMDGAGEVRTFARVVVPLSLPGIATVALFRTFAYWNDYYYPLLFITDSKLYNLQYTVYTMLTNAQFLKSFTHVSGRAGGVAAAVPTESMRMAVAVLTVLPILLAYPFFQRYFVAGLTIGSVKE
jgi:putative aldouronate transport system permease protein